MEANRSNNMSETDAETKKMVEHPGKYGDVTISDGVSDIEEEDEESEDLEDDDDDETCEDCGELTDDCTCEDDEDDDDDDDDEPTDGWEKGVVV